MSRKLAIVVASIAAVTPSLAANSTARVTPFLNSTGTRTANGTGPISSNYCFVVQDSVNEYWWQQYTTLPPVYSVVNVTSITTLVTPYSNGTVTNYETNVHTTNASFTRTQQIGFNPASLLINSAPQPLQTTTALNGSQDLGSILQASPAAFWIYSRLKVITVPAVTNSNGDAVCATTSIAQSVRVNSQPPITLTDETVPGYKITYTYDFANSVGGPPGGPEIFTISGVNSNAEAYFGGYNISGVVSLTEGSVIGTTTDSAATLTNAGTVTTFLGATETLRANSPLWAYSNGATFTYNGPTSTAAAVLTFPTPYIYFPSQGATGATGEAGNDVCIQTGGNENYGYVPQRVIDYIASVPEISSQYPGIASCLPGGPSIIHSFPCAGVAPSSQTVVGTDLTSNTIVTVPGNVNAVGPPDSGPVTSPPSQPSSPAANSPAPNSPSPSPQPGPSPNSPANSPNPQPTSQAANPAPTQNPPANPPDSQPAGSQPNNNPASNSPSNLPGASQKPGANPQNSQPAGNQPNNNAPSNPTANPASPAGQNQASGNPQATNPSSNTPNGQPGASQNPSPNSPNSQPAGNPPNNSPPSNPTASPPVAPGQSQASGGPQASGNSQAPANNPGGIASAIASGIGMSQNPASPTPGSGAGAQGSSSVAGASQASSNSARGSRSATQGSGSPTGGSQGSSNATPGSPSSTRGSGSATGNAAGGAASSPVQASGGMGLINKISIGSVLGVSSALLILVACV